MEDLTIIIPTYNRKQRLLKMLHSIYIQKLSQEVQILILNNASNYNVEESIVEEFGSEVTSNLTVINHRYNVGGALNITLPFYFCETKWLWTLADDDSTTEDSLEIIIKDIHHYEDMGVLKYSFGCIQYQNEVLTSFEQMEEWHKSNSILPFVYCANVVYNMEKVSPYVGDMIDYCYHSITAVIPIFCLLDNQTGKVMLRSESVVNYCPPAPGSGWNDLKLALRIQALWDFPFKASGKMLKNIWGPDDYYHMLRAFKSENVHKDHIRCRVFFQKTFPVMCVNKGLLMKQVMKLNFYLFLYTGKDFLNWLKDKYHLLKNKVA